MVFGWALGLLPLSYTLHPYILYTPASYVNPRLLLRASRPSRGALPPAKRSLPPRVVRLGRRRAEPSGGKRQPESRLESSCYNAGRDAGGSHLRAAVPPEARTTPGAGRICQHLRAAAVPLGQRRSEEHTSEIQSLAYLLCRLLLEKKKKIKHKYKDDVLQCVNESTLV